VAAQPNLERGVALTDVDRDGDTELAVTTGRQAGSFALEREERRWAGFRPFAAWPKVEGTVGRTFWVDLNGDGRADAVIARGDALVWFPSKTGPLDEVEREFGEPVVVPLPTGAEAAPGCGPNPQLDLFFADMTGDGLPDLVRVRRGTVEYWPSLGNGRFGERVVMAGAPTIPTATGFDSTRVRLVDLDGSGTADVLYLDDGRLWHFPNLGGRELGARREVGALPAFDGRSAAIADLAGDGRPSLLWSATSPTRGHALSYLPLVPPTPPGMLIAIDDGCGRRTELAWGNSATHYLRDAAEGVPWETRLPAHRPVVDARVELDLIGGTSVTTRYRYRDGYFDGAGGAFRGFGRVETLDVPQSLPRVGGGGLGDGGVPAGASDEPAFAPPLLTRTWFHLGTAMWNHHRPFEPYAGDPLLPPIGPHVEAPGAHLPADAAAALRLLAGSVVRRERWAVDAAEAPVAHPFDVEQASYQLVLSQPRRGAQRPVFGVVPRVRRVATYEGQGGDPRVTEELVLAHDVWGAPTRTAQVAYARRGAVDDAAQARTWVTVTDSGRADVDVDGQFLLGAELEASQRELVGVAPVGGRLGVEALTAPAVVAALAAPASLRAGARSGGAGAGGAAAELAAHLLLGRGARGPGAVRRGAQGAARPSRRGGVPDAGAGGGDAGAAHRRSRRGGAGLRAGRWPLVAARPGARGRRAVRAGDAHGARRRRDGRAGLRQRSARGDRADRRAGAVDHVAHRLPGDGADADDRSQRHDAQRGARRLRPRGRERRRGPRRRPAVEVGHGDRLGPGGGDGRVGAGGSGGLSRGRGDRDVDRRPRVGAGCDARRRGDGGAPRAGR
jgi:hypothetical protein